MPLPVDLLFSAWLFTWFQALQPLAGACLRWHDLPGVPFWSLGRSARTSESPSRPSGSAAGTGGAFCRGSRIRAWTWAAGMSLCPTAGRTRWSSRAPCSSLCSAGRRGCRRPWRPSSSGSALPSPWRSRERTRSSALGLHAARSNPV